MAWIITNQSKFYLHDNETLLSGLLRVGYQMPYQCCQGYCGTCKIKRAIHDPKTAKINYQDLPLMLLDDDEILPCCCQVMGVLYLQIDE